MIQRSRRTFAPIPKTFVQKPATAGAVNRAAPLATFVRNSDKRGLVAFLLLHTIISSGDGRGGWSTTLHLSVWARAFNTVATATGSSATSAATKILSRLVKYQLIERQRQGRERQVTVRLLQADGSGDPYVRPNGRTPETRFLRLSHEFWAQDWDERLTLPGIAMLLVLLHEKPGRSLPSEHMPKWYGWSADTAERGFRELRDHGLLRIKPEIYTDPISPTGLSRRNLYTVQPPFDAESIDSAVATRMDDQP